MFTILEKSVSDGRLDNFRTLTWRSSSHQPNTQTETFWNIRTPQRKFTFIEYLQLKVLLGFANLTETRCCYDAPGTLKDDLFIDALRAWKTDVHSDILWQRLQLLQRLEQRTEWSMNLYYTLNNCVVYELEEIRRSIRKVNKYSGYVRNSSQVGSKRNLGSSRPEPEIFEWNSNERKIDYYHFLTVGEFFSGDPGNVIFTLMRTKSSKR